MLHEVQPGTHSRQLPAETNQPSWQEVQVPLVISGQDVQRGSRQRMQALEEDFTYGDRQLRQELVESQVAQGSRQATHWLLRADAVEIREYSP